MLPQHPTLHVLQKVLQPYAVVDLLVQISRGSTSYPSDAPVFELWVTGSGAMCEKKIITYSVGKAPPMVHAA